MSLRRNSVVTIESLIDELWGEEPPASAMATLQTYIYQLRRMLMANGLSGKDVLLRRPVGYELRLEPDELDLDVFQRLVSQAQGQLHDGDAEGTLTAVTQALDMCSAAPLHDVCAGQLLNSYISHLDESVLQAMELRIEAKLKLGYYQELVAELKSLCSEHPYHENLHAKLMISLQRMGRRSEALAVYQTIRRNLRDELGIDPSASLEDLQQKLLDSNSSSVGEIESAWQVSEAVIPAELTGRADEIGQLVQMQTPEPDALAPTVVTLTGSPGIGKSALAVRVGHEIGDQFGQGQLYADLGGGSVDPHQILVRFLHSVGFGGEEIPSDLDELSLLFRSWTGRHQLLVLLDNAGSRDQVRPLLTSGPGSAVLITGPELAIGGLEGSRTFRLKAPSSDECVEILRSMVGAEQLAGEEHLAHDVVRLCDRLPAALRIVAAKLATGVYGSLSEAVPRLESSPAGLEELRFGEWDVEKIYASGYRLLDIRGRRALTMVAASGLDSVTTGRVSELCGWDRTHPAHGLGQPEA